MSAYYHQLLKRLASSRKILIPLQIGSARTRILEFSKIRSDTESTFLTDGRGLVESLKTPPRKVNDQEVAGPSKSALLSSGINTNLSKAHAIVLVATMQTVICA